MTISYGDHFWKVFFVWRGSLWKTIYKDLFVHLCLYFTISCIYRLLLSDEQRKLFEQLVPMFNDFTEHIPLTFMLGFYVGMVVKRWWDQFQRVVWPDNFLYWVSAYIRGNDEETRQIRRTIARYTMLGTVMGWRSISTRVLKRFPTLDHVVKAGLMTEREKQMYESVVVRFDPHKQWSIPLNWVLTIVVKAYEDERISHVNELRQIIAHLEAYRDGFMQLFIYDWINIPLVYTQVAVVATYGYFGLCLIGRQYISPKDEKYPPNYSKSVDLYFPFFTVLQFLFYVGWLKVGEDLMNPFGEDDEDFEFNYLLDRHIEMSYLIIDQLHMQLPDNPYCNTPLAAHGKTLLIPHTKASGKIQDACPHSHIRKVPISPSEMELVFPDIKSPEEEGFLAQVVPKPKRSWLGIKEEDAQNKHPSPFRRRRTKAPSSPPPRRRSLHASTNSRDLTEKSRLLQAKGIAPPELKLMAENPHPDVFIVNEGYNTKESTLQNSAETIEADEADNPGLQPYKIITPSSISSASP